MTPKPMSTNVGGAGDTAMSWTFPPVVVKVPRPETVSVSENVIEYLPGPGEKVVDPLTLNEPVVLVDGMVRTAEGVPVPKRAFPESPKPCALPEAVPARTDPETVSLKIRGGGLIGDVKSWPLTLTVSVFLAALVFTRRVLLSCTFPKVVPGTLLLPNTTVI